MTTREKVGRRIADLRAQKGLSIRGLAEKTGCSARVISMWEKGEREPSITMLYALARAFGVEPATLLPQ